MSLVLEEGAALVSEISSSEALGAATISGTLLDVELSGLRIWTERLPALATSPGATGAVHCVTELQEVVRAVPATSKTEPGPGAEAAKFQPGTPLTLQETMLFVAPETREVKVCESPNSTDAVAGFTVTLMEERLGVGGVGMTELAIPQAHPAAHIAVARKSRIRRQKECGCASALESVTALSERRRMN